MGSLDGKVALVTGSARNIGREIALSLARDGANVVINARSSLDDARSVAEEIERLGRQSLVVQADISSSGEANDLVNRAAAHFGRLDIGVLNAALRRQKPVTEISDEEWHEVTGVALNGAFFVSRAAVPHLRDAGGGRLVFIGGSPSHMGSKGRTHVCAAKMGAVGLMRALATELGPDGITCNTVAPGHIDTSRGESAGARSATGGQGRPIERMGDVTEIARTVAFVCSDAAAYMTGQTLHVNGGMYYG